MTQRNHHRGTDIAEKKDERKTQSENQNDYSNRIAYAIHRYKPSPYCMQEICCQNNNPARQQKGALLAPHSE